MEWSEVIDNPLLKNLPFKIELNRFGKLLIYPIKNGQSKMRGSYKNPLHIVSGFDTD
ncbi:hypothetical protein [Thiofilum flexile]|uniref:hypothetical protein n=1 Tax=Thiofilum flexile TaxID=125627 RepID=UPI00037674E9|nr:hypothetical protein [Thiofilum flexile]